MHIYGELIRMCGRLYMNAWRTIEYAHFLEIHKNNTFKRSGFSNNGMDVIIDDGEHSPHANMRTLECAWPLLEGGYYFIEDILTGSSRQRNNGFFWAQTRIPDSRHLYILKKVGVILFQNFQRKRRFFSGHTTIPTTFWVYEEKVRHRNGGVYVRNRVDHNSRSGIKEAQKIIYLSMTWCLESVRCGHGVIPSWCDFLHL